jgi:hypothetical protein
MNPTFENIVVSAAVTLVLGLPLSTYAGVIVARFAAFEAVLNQARSLILNLEHSWEFRYLGRPIPDPESASGRRTIFTSKDVSNNTRSWQLTQLGLQMKELGHWDAAQAIDAVWLELDGLREDFLSKSKLAPKGAEKDILEYVADWHRSLSRQRPDLWRILKPWPNKRDPNLSCVSVTATGEWHEVEPAREKKNSEEA